MTKSPICFSRSWPWLTKLRLQPIFPLCSLQGMRSKHEPETLCAAMFPIHMETVPRACTERTGDSPLRRSSMCCTHFESGPPFWGVTIELCFVPYSFRPQLLISGHPENITTYGLGTSPRPAPFMDVKHEQKLFLVHCAPLIEGQSKGENTSQTGVKQLHFLLPNKPDLIF